jgi:hypothetical protein
MDGERVTVTGEGRVIVPRADQVLEGTPRPVESSRLVQ